jgi:transposase-like protein
VTREESAELRDLRKRNRLLEQENEVLRKAAAHLAQGNARNAIWLRSLATPMWSWAPRPPDS